MKNKNVLLCKNLFNYEEVLPPPSNLPEDMVTLYLTDDDHNSNLAKGLGWDIVKKTEEFLDIHDKFERRKIISYINAFPHKVAPEVLEFNFVFVCDGNVISLWENYKNFVNACSDDYSLFLTSGYYNGSRNTIQDEAKSSRGQARWAYNHEQITNTTERYVKELTELGIDVNNLGVVSAKYIGWNLKHKNYDAISKSIYDQGCLILQGNIYLTYISGIYPKDVFVYYCNDYSGGIIANHLYNA
jgi:hypothetical protein